MFNLQEAREAIKDKPEFVCNERSFGFVIDYNVAFAETFTGKTDRETLILQNLRGTCFDHNGKIIRLAYHKFHNLNENPEYAAEKFNFYEHHIIQEKLDGSMVTPIPYGGNMWWFGTRAGVTEVAAKAQKLLDSWSAMEMKKYKAYNAFIQQCLQDNMTPIFEFCSREQRIVIDYEVPRLVLTDIRCNETGRYIDIYYCAGFQRGYIPEEVELVRPFDGIDSNNITEFAAVVKTLLGEEGVVVKFGDGRFVKIKADDYCLKHRALDGLRFEKDVLRLVLENKLDDIYPIVTPEMKERLVAYSTSVLNRYRMVATEIVEMFERNRHVASKKDFAELVVKSPYKTFLFKLWDGKELALADYILSKCGSSTGVEEVRWAIGKSWNEF